MLITFTFIIINLFILINLPFFKFKNKLINYIKLSFLLLKFNINTLSIVYIKNLCIILIIDCCLVDDEPLWEPLEWTMVQNWLLFFFIFSWISETIITSNYGSFTGRDKRVYNGLFKWFWWMEIWFNFNMFLTCVFIIVPFYFELTYNVSYIITWWSWYNRFFFFKFITIWLIIDLFFNIIVYSLKWLNWKKLFILCNVITFILFYLLFTQFILTYFAYFTDILWYKKTNWCDFNKLSQGPQKWGWGDTTRDHFYYHKTTSNFWFKNDSLYASALFFINMINFLLLLLTILQWLLLIRQLYTIKTVSYTFLIYGFSTLNMYFVNVMLLFSYIILTLIYQLIRTSYDFLWITFTNDFYNILNQILINLL